MAFRVFPSGQVPTAEVLQKYLMNQVVISCVSTARPPTPVDGMPIFETDTGTFRIWAGGLWARLAKVGTWDDDGDLHVTGSIDATGGITATGALAGATVAATGDVSARGLAVARIVKGKVYVGTAVDTSSASTSFANITGANVQSVPVIAGHAYRASYQVGLAGDTLNDRVRYSLWNGTVGGTQLGAQMPIFRITGAVTTFVTVTFSFMWAAPATTTIANVNLAMIRFGGGGSLFTRVEDTSYVGVIEDLGLASTITNL